MKRLILATGAAILLGGVVLQGTPADQGKGKKHGQQDQAYDRRDERRDTSVSVHVVFGRGEVAILRSHYAPRYRNLPPGLQKKLARGKGLPPGWQKKFEPFPVALERQLNPLPTGYRRGVIDGHAVIFNSRTNVMVDLAVLF